MSLLPLNGNQHKAHGPYFMKVFFSLQPLEMLSNPNMAGSLLCKNFQLGSCQLGGQVIKTRKMKEEKIKLEICISVYRGTVTYLEVSKNRAQPIKIMLFSVADDEGLGRV